MKMHIEVTTVVELEADPRLYPGGMDLDTAIFIEIEQVASEPFEYLVLPDAKTSVVSQFPVLNFMLNKK